jgi:hypothetical protein
MIEDLISGDDDDSGSPPVGPAFMPGAKMGPSELPMYEVMHLRGGKDFPGSREVLFTAINEEDGSEIWDPPQPPDFADDSKTWQRLMGWPRVPTVAEARAFQLNARMGLLAAWWTRLAAARSEDDQRRPGDYSTKAAGRYAGVAET